MRPLSARQFIASLSIIWRSDHTNRPLAVVRHLLWQAYKLRPHGEIRRRLSRSVLTDDEPGGVISMVNMLGLYDFNNMKFVQTMLEGGGVFVDVGANIGSYTLLASESAAVTVVSLEPNPVAFRKLQRNLTLNARGNVKAINRAAAARPGMLRMTANGSDSTNRVIAADVQAGRTVDVEADSLDAICAALDLSPKVIKIDVEGYEPDVLEGAATCLTGTLACVVENGDRPRVRELMSERAFRGPFYYRHRLGWLSRQPQRLAEDAIYIGRAFEGAFPRIHFDAQEL
jgi:FkbM family methyltransferase